MYYVPVLVRMYYSIYSMLKVDPAGQISPGTFSLCQLGWVGKGQVRGALPEIFLLSSCNG